MRTSSTLWILRKTLWNKKERYTQPPPPTHTHTSAHYTHTQMFEDAMKSEQAEKHALEKQVMTLQQRLLDDTDAEKEFMAAKKQ